MQTVYICEHCGMHFNEWEQCYDHESGQHIKPESYSVKALRYLPYDCETNNHDDIKYPLDITVTMADGSVAEYTFTRVVIPAKVNEQEVA